MKKVIANKLYNTETAREIGEFWNGLSPRNFAHVTEHLYCKRTGEYFLYGEGGPASRYSVSTGDNSWSGGEKIIPMSYESARQWAEEHLSSEKYQEEFGPVGEGDEGTVVLTISLPAAVADRLRRTARERQTTVSGLIASMI